MQDLCLCLKDQMGQIMEHLHGQDETSVTGNRKELTLKLNKWKKDMARGSLMETV